MPLTEQDMSYEAMVKSARNERKCGQCQKLLTIRNGAYFGFKGHILSCGNMTHNTIAGFDKEYEQSVNIKELRRMESNALMTMPKEKMLQRIGMAKFPQDLTQLDRNTLAEIAITYGFDPLMGEVTIYQGRPFVSIDGRYRKAQETGCLDGIETRPANKEERAAWEIPDGDYFFRAEVYRKGALHPFVGWGRVRRQETVGGKGFKPVETNPQRMAEKRAEAQALRKAFHIPLPSTEDIGSPDVEVTIEPPRQVDTTTGEIVEQPEATQQPAESQTTSKEPEPTQAKDSTKETPGETQASVSKPTNKMPGETKPKRDPASIKTIEQLAAALKNDFALTYQQQWDELNIKSWRDLGIKPSEAYVQVAAARQ